MGECLAVDYGVPPVQVAPLPFGRGPGFYAPCSPARPAQPNTLPAAGAGPPPPDPVTLAVNFWQTIPLPVPKPAIPPGYAVTGKPAYLVTNGTTAPATYTDDTPLGPLAIQATGTYMIDWGDPAAAGWTGPYRTEGRPYPNGNIEHVYDNVGTVTVTVQENWTAIWHLAGDTGALGGLGTTATISGFNVQQLQAIITN